MPSPLLGRLARPRQIDCRHANDPQHRGRGNHARGQPRSTQRRCAGRTNHHSAGAGAHRRHTHRVLLPWEHWTQPWATVIAGLAVLIAAFITLIIAWLTRRQTDRHWTASNRQQRFIEAARQLADPNPAVRIAGVAATETLTDGWLTPNPLRRFFRRPANQIRRLHAQQCVNVLTAYLRIPATHPPDNNPTIREEHITFTRGRASSRDRGNTVERHHHYTVNDDEVRASITRTIAAHLRQEPTGRSWSALTYDLTGAHLRDVNFAATVWEHGPDFTNGVFTGATIFDFATFGDYTRFGGASFGPWVGFEMTKFGRSARFAQATFGDKVSFGRATFGDNARFGGAAFGDDARFIRATFGDNASFGGATFGDKARFDSTTFGDNARFGGTTYGFGALFGDATFGDNAWFGGATFSRASFIGATFGWNRPPRPNGVPPENWPLSDDHPADGGSAKEDPPGGEGT